MAFFKQSAARHRAETPSHAVRNTTIATAVAGAAVIGSVAPAQAYAEVPTDTATAYSAPASALTTYSSAAPQAVVAPQIVSTASTKRRNASPAPFKYSRRSCCIRSLASR